jgi:predicted nucleic-acid-binding protein
MIGLDTNILARYYIEDKSDAEAVHQSAKAQRLIDSGQLLLVSKTVILELEWLMRGYYGFRRDETIAAFRHLQTLKNIVIEDRDALTQALSENEAGLEFADAFHHGSYRQCESVVSFDDKRFARRVKKLALSPPVIVPR